MLAAAMVLGSLTGCGTGQKEESKETAAVTEAAKAGEDAAAAAAQEAGTQAEDGEKKVYAFVSKTAADPIFLLMFDGYKAACDKLGVEAAPPLHKGGKFIQLGTANGGLHVRCLQVIPEMGIHVFVVISQRKLPELPVKPVSAHVVTA